MDTIWKILAYCKARLGEPSTYPALMLIGTGVAHWATADYATKTQIVTSLGLIIAGLIGAVLPDRIGKNTRADDPDKTLPPATPQKGTTP